VKILDIKSGDLYQSLDDYTSGEKISDYTTEKVILHSEVPSTIELTTLQGFVTQANRVVRFKRLPEMIAFQLQVCGKVTDNTWINLTNPFAEIELQ